MNESGGEAEVFNLGDPRKISETILKIENSFFTNADFEKYVRATLGDDQKALTAASLSRLFDDFIQEKIFLEAAMNQNLSLTEEEKREYLAKFSKEIGPDEESSLDADVVGILFDRLLIEKYTYALVRDIAVSDAEVKEYYNLRKRDFLRPERVKVSQILLKSEDKAIEIYERVSGASEEEFRRIARQESVGLEAFKGGEMGVFEMGQLPYEMEKVVFYLQEGDISPVIESAYGFHIFRLDQRFEPELISEQEAAVSIRSKLRNHKIQQRLSDHFEELKTTTDWTFYPWNMSFPYQRNDG